MKPNSEIQRYFTHSALLALVIVFVALRLEAYEWVGRFAFIALLMTSSWFCSALSLQAWTERRTAVFAGALTGKLLLLTVLILGLRQTGAEVTSFLAGMNLFFAAVILRQGGAAIHRRLQRETPVPATISALQGEPSNHA